MVQHQDAPLTAADASSRDIVAAAAIGIVAVDADARILSANAAALSMLRTDESDLLGRSVC